MVLRLYPSSTYASGQGRVGQVYFHTLRHRTTAISTQAQQCRMRMLYESSGNFWMHWMLQCVTVLRRKPQHSVAPGTQRQTHTLTVLITKTSTIRRGISSHLAMHHCSPSLLSAGTENEVSRMLTLSQSDTMRLSV